MLPQAPRLIKDFRCQGVLASVLPGTLSAYVRAWLDILGVTAPLVDGVLLARHLLVPELGPCRAPAPLQVAERALPRRRSDRVLLVPSWT